MISLGVPVELSEEDKNRIDKWSAVIAIAMGLAIVCGVYSLFF